LERGQIPADIVKQLKKDLAAEKRQAAVSKETAAAE